MHVLGKVLIWLIVLGTIGATLLTAEMLQVRNSWSKKSEDVRASLEKNAAELAEKAAKRNLLRNELVRLERGWGRYWQNVAIEPAQDVDALASRGGGTNRGFVAGNVVYVFQPNPEGSYTFVGPYVVAETTNEAVLVLDPAWPTRANVPTEMSYGDGWRIRQMIPNANKSRFGDLTVELAINDELLLSKQKNVDIQNQMVSVAEQHLELRQRELNGEPDNQQHQGSLPQYMIDGLVKAIQDTEEDRNTVLTKVDELRRRLFHTYQQYQTVRDANKKLAKRLTPPQPLVTVGASR